jgi:hypothetical protein
MSRFGENQTIITDAEEAEAKALAIAQAIALAGCRKEKAVMMNELDRSLSNIVLDMETEELYGPNDVHATDGVSEWIGSAWGKNAAQREEEEIAEADRLFDAEELAFKARVEEQQKQRQAARDAEVLREELAFEARAEEQRQVRVAQ